MANINLNQRFSPAEAVRGDHAPIDMSTIGTYVSGDSEGVSRGRYAQLSYIVGSESGAININVSGVSLAISALNIDEPVTIDYITNTVSISSMDFVNTTAKYPQTVGIGSSAVVTFTPPVDLVEVYNMDGVYNVFLSFIAADTYNDVISGGLSIDPQAYYSIDRKTSRLTLANNNISAVDVRVFGHYRS